MVITPFLCIVVVMRAAAWISSAGGAGAGAGGSSCMRMRDHHEVGQRGSSYLAYVFPGPGQFLTTLALGTPPLTFTAILDTGSDLVWRQCLPCSLCYPQSPPPSSSSSSLSLLCPSSLSRSRRHPRPRHHLNCSFLLTPSNTSLFDPSLSSSYSAAPCSHPACLAFSGTSCSPLHTCSYNTVYIAPSAYTRGILSFDTLTISSILRPPAHIPHFAFGCSHSSKAPYNFAGAGGIVGFGRSPLSLPSQLNVSRFSYCLGSINDTTSPSPLVLGPAASLGESKDAQSMDILKIDYGYVVELIAISVAGKPLNISSSSLGLNIRDFGVSTAAGGAGIIFDSGTTFTHLPPIAFQALIDAFQERIDLPHAAARPHNLTVCYEYPGTVPSLSFHFNGATMHLPPQNYFVSIEGVFCLAFLESAGEDLSIFGNVQQQNYHILYDLEANVISFKPTQCNALLMKESYP